MFQLLWPSLFIASLCVIHIHNDTRTDCSSFISAVLLVPDCGRDLCKSLSSLKSRIGILSQKVQIIVIDYSENENCPKLIKECAVRYQLSVTSVAHRAGRPFTYNDLLKLPICGTYVTFTSQEYIWRDIPIDQIHVLGTRNKTVSVITGNGGLFDPIEQSRLPATTINPLQSSQLRFRTFWNSFLNTRTFLRVIGRMCMTAPVVPAELICSILLDCPCVSILQRVLSQSRCPSSVQTFLSEPFIWTSRYTQVDAYSKLSQAAKSLFGEIPRIIQTMLLDALPTLCKAPCEKSEKYRTLCLHQLRSLDIDLLLTTSRIPCKLKIQYLSLYCQRDIRPEIAWSPSAGFTLFHHRLEYEPQLTFQHLKSNGTHLLLCAEDDSLLALNETEYYFTDHSHSYSPLYSPFSALDKETVFGCFYKGRLIRFTIPLQHSSELRLYLRFRLFRIPVSLSVGKHSIIPAGVFAYSHAHAFLLSLLNNNGLRVTEYSIASHLSHEISYMQELMSKKRFGALFYRLCYYLISPSSEIWLLLDRTDMANDNAEALFHYLHSIQPKGIRYYYCLQKASSDYGRLNKLGHLVNTRGLFFPIYLLLADKVIDSYANEDILNPFGSNQQYLRDIIHYQHVFLQHGVTKDDISPWLNAFSMDFSRFFVAAQREKQALLEPQYGFSDGVIKLAGFPRHDNLFKASRANLTRENSSLILFLPTYRQSLYLTLRQYPTEYANALFQSTQFFHFWSTLIASRTLQVAMERYNYTGLLCLHPNFMRYLMSFKSTKWIRVSDTFAPYQSIFINATILVTDYSSVAFEMAYLRKPVVYAQFDRDSFFQQHAYKPGYFDYVRDGFGDVTNGINDTVNSLAKLMEQGGNLSPLYLDRVREFFEYYDDKNSERVYQSILQLPRYNRAHRLSLILLIITFSLARIGQVWSMKI